MRPVYLALALALAGCKTTEPPPPPVTVAPAPPKIPLAAECVPTKDPRWLDLPDREARRDDGARNYRENKERFGEIEGLRAVCWAAMQPYAR